MLVLVLLIIGIGTVAGVLLGVRLKVLVLFPATLIAIAVVTVAGIANGYELWVIALAVFETMASVQIGYIVGSILATVISAYLPAWTTIRRHRGTDTTDAITAKAALPVAVVQDSILDVAVDDCAPKHSREFDG